MRCVKSGNAHVNCTPSTGSLLPNVVPTQFVERARQGYKDTNKRVNTPCRKDRAVDESAAIKQRRKGSEREGTEGSTNLGDAMRKFGPVNQVHVRRRRAPWAKAPDT